MVVVDLPDADFMFDRTTFGEFIGDFLPSGTPIIGTMFMDDRRGRSFARIIGGSQDEMRDAASLILIAARDHEWSAVLIAYNAGFGGSTQPLEIQTELERISGAGTAAIQVIGPHLLDRESTW